MWRDEDKLIVYVRGGFWDDAYELVYNNELINVNVHDRYAMRRAIECNQIGFLRLLELRNH